MVTLVVHTKLDKSGESSGRRTGLIKKVLLDSRKCSFHSLSTVTLFIKLFHQTLNLPVLPRNRLRRLFAHLRRSHETIMCPV